VYDMTDVYLNYFFVFNNNFEALIFIQNNKSCSIFSPLIAPLITDLPIILISVAIITKITESNTILGIISFCGAVFIAKMGLENITIKPLPQEAAAPASRSTLKGIMTNILSPHPYLFWLTVGVPIMSKAMAEGYLLVAAFLGSFYVLLVGSKIILAIAVGRSKSFLSGKLYLITIKTLGCILWGLAGLLFYDGVQLIFTSG